MANLVRLCAGLAMALAAIGLKAEPAKVARTNPTIIDAFAAGEYPQTAERYIRLALKAQLACRATLKALARLRQPRERTVKHVHDNEGGQAVVANHVHNHPGGAGNAELAKQSDATGTAGDRAALPGPDPLGNGVPIPSREGPEAVPDARRHKSRRA